MAKEEGWKKILNPHLFKTDFKNENHKWMEYVRD